MIFEVEIQAAITLSTMPAFVGVLHHSRQPKEITN